MPQPPMPPTNHQLMPVTTPTTRPTIPLAQPMPHDTVATLNKKRHRRLNVRIKWNQTYRKPCVPQDVSIHTHLLNINIVSFYILYYDIGHPQHNLKRNNILFYFYFSSNSFWSFLNNQHQPNNPTNLLNFHQFRILLIFETTLHKNARGQKYNNVNNVW